MSSPGTCLACGEELVTELIRTLPKQLRTRFVPAPDVARDVLTRLDPGRGALTGQLSAELGRIGGVSVPADAFDLAKLPPHLRLTFRVTDDGQVLASGKDLGQLQGRAAAAAAGTPGGPRPAS